MNQKNVILGLGNVLNTYKFWLPKGQISRLKYRKWLPLIQDSPLARVSAFMVAKVMGDGNLDEKFTCRFIGQFDDLCRLRELIIKHYSIAEASLKIRMRKYRGISYLLQVNDCLFGRFLFALGAPVGNKTKTEFLIPEWIIASEYSKKYFLQGIFDDELATLKVKRKRFIREAGFKMAKLQKYQGNLREFLSQIRNLTESFSVSCSKIDEPRFESVQKDGNKTYYQCFRILGNRSNIINFRNNINFGLNWQKIAELEKCISFVKYKTVTCFFLLQCYPLFLFCSLRNRCCRKY